MITFQRFENGLYLTQADIANPAAARVGFFFQNQSRTDSTFEFSSAAWTNPADLGYFAFFTPSETRDWNAFASGAFGIFQAASGSQFGWFTDNNGAVTGESLILVGNQGSSSSNVQGTFQLVFNNIVLQIVSSPIPTFQPIISFDDPSNAFQITNPTFGNPAVRLSIIPISGSQQVYYSNSQYLSLPLAGPGAGSVNAAFQLAVSDLALFEAGVQFFANGSSVGEPLVALSYPVFQGPGGAQSSFNFSAWLDVLQPLVDTRSYFQFTDPRLGSYFAGPTGQSFDLFPNSSGDLSTVARFAFANRPIQNTTNQVTNYYLTPAGQFSLTLPASANLQEDAAPVQKSILCGITGTELLTAAIGTMSAPADMISFGTGKPAYVLPQPENPTTDDPTFLGAAGGNTTTSWAQFMTASGSYISQPEQSPLYNQPGNSAAKLSGDAPGDLSVYLLDFLPLPAWFPPASINAGEQLASSPLVPLVPYSGIPFTTNLAPFRVVESTALNPTRKNLFTGAQSSRLAAPRVKTDAQPANTAMTPQGLLAGLSGDPQQPTSLDWQTIQLATSVINNQQTPVEFASLGTAIRGALQQNQVFAVISTTGNGSLFDFTDDSLNISDWLFSLTPDGLADPSGVPPILILKFYQGHSISDLVGNIALWSQPQTFNPSFTPVKAQTYLGGIIQSAGESVQAEGANSLYYNFYEAVTNPNFEGILAVNCNLQLNALPSAIRAVLGGMTKTEGDKTVSNIDAFRAHHVGIQINDTDPNSPMPNMSQSSLFGLVDYEKPKSTQLPAVTGGLDINYNFEVEYLRALFTNSELRSFSCQINLTINNLFQTSVALNSSATHGLTAGVDSNVVVITGSYQAHSNSGNDANSGQGVYSFAAEGQFVFNFDPNNPYLDNITLTKLQFSFLQETPQTSLSNNSSTTSTIQSRFSIWGSMSFKKLNVLNIFSFDKLSFADLGIDVSYNLTITTGQAPQTTPPDLSFSPGDLRFDLGQTTYDEGDTSLLSLLPFRLKSFLYSENADQTIESLKYYALTDIPGQSFVADKFNFALEFDLDLGSLGSLVGSLAAFKFSFLIGWLSGDNGGIAFGVQLPQADGKLEINIQGVLTLSIQYFKLQYNTVTGTNTSLDGKQILVLALHNCYMQLLGQRLPPGTGLFDFALFAPVNDSSKIGWIAAYNDGESGVNPDGGDKAALAQPARSEMRSDHYNLPELTYAGAQNLSDAVYVATTEQRQTALATENGHGATALADSPQQRASVTSAKRENGGGSSGTTTLEQPAFALPSRGQLVPVPNGGDTEDSSPVLQIVYLGGGQRVGPDPENPPTTFNDFLKFMQGKFWDEIKKSNYDAVYHPDSNWLVLADLKLLGIIEVGFVFYDVTPFYSLMLNVKDWFEFEITYTKISESMGLFYANFTLPETLRTFEVGAASLTLPSIGVSVYTNGNWKLDVGFPDNGDWSRSFRVQAMAGPVPVTGSGGFYLASLSAATYPGIFQTPYPSIIAFGFAARMGVGKDFTAGPLKAGISVTFFGIIEGAAGYLSNGSTDILTTPDGIYLSGQFGIIGQIYGSIDFKIIKASVNVTLQASIGIVLHFERNNPNFKGTILLYVQASVSLSVSVSINLGFFSISISFSFNASFRFQWELGGSSSGQAKLLRTAILERHATRLLAAQAVALCPGLNAAVALWFSPELTVLFPDTTSAGTPWLASTLAIPYDSKPAPNPEYSQFQPFEAVTTQLVTWALINALNLPAYNATVTEEELDALDQNPNALLGGIDYYALLEQLGNFTATVTVPTATVPTTASATVFPMPPFLQIQTNGRQEGGQAADFDYQFSSKNPVDQNYLATVDAYFNQLFVNQTSAAPTLLAAEDVTQVPLTQEIFADYFTGLIRGAVHQLLQTIQNEGLTSSPLDQLIRATVGAGGFVTAAGQMSSQFRSGARLPYTEGLTIPGGHAQTTTNALYALLWQEFPVGQLSGSPLQYTVSLSNPDTTQTWITASAATWTLTDTILAPYTQLTAADITPATTPTQLPFTNTGPQSFAFSNTITWTQPGPVTLNLLPFPTNLERLQSAGNSPINVLVESRETGSAYLPDGTPLAEGTFTWATSIDLTILQVPSATGGQMLPDIFALSGASQQDQQLLEMLLAHLSTNNPIAAIQVLYQTAAGQSGLSSATINTADVFVLRTNTTTVSVPPPNQSFRLEAEAAPPADVSVGANIATDYDFLQIVQQATVTNAPGYYLRYIDTDGNSLSPNLFNGGPATVTILITYIADGTQNTQQSPSVVQPYYNSIVLNTMASGQVYYAETTAPALEVQYNAVAAGSVGVDLTRANNSASLRTPAKFSSLLALNADDGHTHGDLIQALYDAGVTDENELLLHLAEAGIAPTQLNALYSLITYQVQASTGFIQSNLSTPIQPQRPASASDTFSDYRVFVPLYNLARSNQSASDPNRYASLGDWFSIDFYQNDAFGNQMPTALPFRGTNLYFDPITPVDQWLGVVPSFNFLDGGSPQANTVTVTLAPSATAFQSLTIDQAAAALTLYDTINHQISGPGVSFYIESNIALNADGSLVQVTLTSDQVTSIRTMVLGIIDYLKTYTVGKPFTGVSNVTLPVAVTGTGTLPPVFTITVLFGIQRDASLISPLLKDGEVIIFPSAQNVNSPVSPDPLYDVSTLAGQFVLAFTALRLSVGLGGADQTPSSTGQTAANLRVLGVASDGTGQAQSNAQALWAVQASLLNISIGTATNSGPFYLAPKPLDNTLNTGDVPLPVLPSPLPQLPQTQLFVDVDLDTMGRSFFQAVDAILAPASAARTFELAQPAYTTIANDRKGIADKYSTYEVEWLFPEGSPFTGSAVQLGLAQTAFGQQMRAALLTAYAVDTVLQYGVTWTNGVPAGAGDRIGIFGQVQTVNGQKTPGFGLSTAQVTANESGTGLLTFLYGTENIANESSVTLDLEYNVTHVQYFLQPSGATPADEARPSIWLQLIDPYPAGIPHIGPSGTQTLIPLVYRVYPTPPTVANQSGIAGSSSAPSLENPVNPLIAAAEWHYLAQYQAYLTEHDQILGQITYNTNLNAAQNKNANALLLGDDTIYSLFQSLARFTAAYAVLQPILTNPVDQNWAAAAGAFASLVDTVMNNRGWNPATASAFAGPLANITDNYRVTDLPSSNQREITLTWNPSQGESSFAGVTLSIEAIGPDGSPYPNQIPGTVPNGITNTYNPVPPLSDPWVTHQLEIDSLNVLSAENALFGIQIERNLIAIPSGDTTFTPNGEFIYLTPLVRPSQPVTPFVDNSEPIDVVSLPNQGASTGCGSTSPALLCQRVYTILYDLIGDPAQVTSLVAARASALFAETAEDTTAVRRVKMACGFQYPVTPGNGSAPIMPQIPVVLARSFEIDGSQTNQISQFAALYSAAIQTWSVSNQVTFGTSAAPGGGQFIFDITLYAQLSGLNTPVLRLRNLQLDLTDIQP